MLISKDREQLIPLLLISILMILYSVASIVYWQLCYTVNDRRYKGDLNNVNLLFQIIHACDFTVVTTFNLAHWVFAFSFLALSYRLELISKDLPEDTRNCRLNTFNVIVCLVNVAIPAI